MSKIDSYWETALQCREFTLVLSGDLEGWDKGVGGRSEREGTYVYLKLIHFIVQQKLTQHCKETIPQLQKNYFEVTDYLLTPPLMTCLLDDGIFQDFPYS